MAGGAVGGERARLDQILVARGLAPTRSRARDLILRGAVVVAGAPCRKPGQSVPPGADVRVADLGSDGAGSGARYVSRGALKLLHALDHFAIDVTGRIALDIGASTGGFTQVLLEHGAARVFAVDVGHGQLAGSLAADPRVVVLEGLDARVIGPEHVPEPPLVVTADLSFISLTQALPVVLGFAAPGAVLIALVKPQFEVGQAAIGKGGIVRDAAARMAAVDAVCRWLEQDAGWQVLGATPSPITGKSGNVEYLIAARMPALSPS